MPWLKRYIDEHRCEKPNLAIEKDVYRGDIWECPVETCKKRYVVHDDQRDGHYFVLEPPKQFPFPGHGPGTR
jgi:hypothetical protein